MPITKKQERILKLAERGGTDKELLLLEEISALEEKVNEIEAQLKEEMKKMMSEMADVKTGIPHFSELIDSIKTLAEKEIPAPIVNIPETKVEVKAPIVNIQPANVQVSAPNVNVPPPIVTVNSETKKVEIDETTKEAILDLQSAVEGLKKENTKIKEQRPVIFGPGKTRVVPLDLSSSLNGVTKTFFVGTNFGIIGVWGSSSPFPFRPIVDYTESGRNIVFNAAIDASISLAAGQTLMLQYLR